MNVKLCYLYRDGANYKSFNEVIFSNPKGLSIQKIRSIIKESLIDGLWFVAKDWNLPDMHFKDYSWDIEIDHDWHEIESLEETNDLVTTNISIEDFISKIKIYSTKR